MPLVLEEGKYVVAPEPIIVEKRGLEEIQLGYEFLKKGVSVRKVVVLAEYHDLSPILSGMGYCSVLGGKRDISGIWQA